MLRLLATLEQVNEDTTDDLLGENFGYIVLCQVYGNTKKNRVAYIDNIRINIYGIKSIYEYYSKSNLLAFRT